MATRTPWGLSDQADPVTRGIIFYGTPSHGGYHVSKKLNASMPDHLRRADGWYEEDCDWALVVIAFPQFFQNTRHAEQAEATLKNWHPDAWEIQYGRKLNPEESFVLRDRARAREERRLLDAGFAVRVSAMTVPEDRVHVLFRRADGSTVGVYMSAAAYDSIPLRVPATPHDYAAKGFILTEAPGDFYGRTTKEVTHG